MDNVTYGTVFEINQPPFHSGNWSKFLSGADSRLKYVRVIDGVASLCDKFVLIRFDLNKTIPDGFYLIDRRTLIKTKPPMSFGGARYSWPNVEYPDIEAFNPDFATLSTLEKIDRSSIEEMMSVADRIQRQEGDVCITPTGIRMRQYGRDSAFSYKQNFGFTPENLELYVRGKDFYVAMVELLRYDYSYFMIRRINENSACLVFGHTWNNCVLVSVNGMSKNDGQYLR